MLFSMDMMFGAAAAVVWHAMMLFFAGDMLLPDAARPATPLRRV